MAEFYRSVYSHSIPWATLGKDVSKARLRHKGAPAHWSEELDKALGCTVNGQTNGLPVGPDTSFVIGELIMSAVDHAVWTEPCGAAGFRYFDDHEFVTRSADQAQDVLGRLQTALASFDLLLNPRKTAIVELPATLVGSGDWLHTFGATRVEVDQLLTTFERAFQVSKLEPQSSVLGFAINRLSTVRVWTDPTWALAQDLMAQAVIVDPGCLHQFVRAIVRIWIQHGRRMQPDLLNSVLTSTVLDHAPRGHGSEVAWAIWAAMSFDVRLSSEVAAAASAMDDDVVAMVCLDADSRKTFEGGLDPSRWASWMVAEQLYGEHWLVAYEAHERGLLPSLDRSDYVAADPGFLWLRANSVLFTKPFRRPSRASLSAFPTPTRGY